MIINHSINVFLENTLGSCSFYSPDLYRANSNHTQKLFNHASKRIYSSRVISLKMITKKFKPFQDINQLFKINSQTHPNKFRLEFYANNLNKKEEERASLDKIGTLLYDDTGDHSKLTEQLASSNSLLNLENFILTPVSIPIDWLVIVGSYLSLSIALVGVKAKQSITTFLPPTEQLLVSTSFNSQSFDTGYNNQKLSQSSLINRQLQPGSIIVSPSSNLPQISSPNFKVNNSVPLLPTPNNMPLIMQSSFHNQHNSSAPNLVGLSSWHLKESHNMPPPHIITNQAYSHISSPSQFRAHPYSRPSLPQQYQNNRNNCNNYYNNNNNKYKDFYNRNYNENNNFDINNNNSNFNNNKNTTKMDVDQEEANSKKVTLVAL